jgi:aryl-alcohol dehydrogenase-like predicted oxidoreductase
MVSPTWPGCLSITRTELQSLAGVGHTVLAWASLAMGYFAGRDAPNWDCPENEARRGRARDLAERLGTTPNAVALSYVLHQHENALAVIGTRSLTHLSEALAAPELELTPEQVAWLPAGFLSRLTL